MDLKEALGVVSTLKYQYRAYAHIEQILEKAVQAESYVRELTAELEAIQVRLRAENQALMEENHKMVDAVALLKSRVQEETEALVAVESEVSEARSALEALKVETETKTRSQASDIASALAKYHAEAKTKIASIEAEMAKAQECKAQIDGELSALRTKLGI